MDAKTLDIVKAGWAMFARYGYAKTTMSDIAGEAGVARQTVYNAFSSKEDILRAVVRLAGEEALSEVQAAWADAGSLSEKISIFQSLGPECWYKAMVAAPDWGALMDGMNRAAASELADLETRWVRVIETMFAETLRTERETYGEVAHFLYTASKNTKYGAEGLEDVQRRLATIHKATLALLA
ncbi:MAG: helix-turn-helix domain-containing protein [Pseudomonadota bacterium]